ncbi:MAG: hypothetical protein AAGA96_05855 [Verrucomicrobiota bacterium]
MNSPAQSYPPNQAPQSSGGGGKWVAGCGIGCLIIIILAVVLGFVAFNVFKEKSKEFIDNYTADEAVEIVEPALQKPEIEDAVARFDAFKSAVSAGETPPPLVLDQDDINALIYHHSDFSALAGKAIVEMEDNLLRSQISLDLDALEIPIPFIADQVEGKFFNGEAAFSLSMPAGRPSMFIEELQMNGAMVPEVVMSELRSENLMKDLISDPEMKAFFDQISDMKIEGGELKILPKPAN